MFNFLNPYLLGGAALVAGAVGLNTYFLDKNRDDWRNQAHKLEKVLAERDATIASMTSAQNDQTKKSEENIVRITQPAPQIIRITEELKNAPLPADCKTPTIPEEAKKYL